MRSYTSIINELIDKVESDNMTEDEKERVTQQIVLLFETLCNRKEQ